MIKKLIYQDDKSNKFWNIETSGKIFIVTFGKTGTTGQTQKKEFDSEDECIKEAEKLVKEKLKKGYVENNDTSDGNKDDDTSIEKYLHSKTELEATFYDFDHEYERRIDIFVDLIKFKIDMDYYLEINTDYLDPDKVDEYDCDTRSDQKTLSFISAQSMKKFITLLVDKLDCYEVYYDYDGVQSIENEIFMKLIELFFSCAVSEKSKQSGDIITEDKFLKCIKEIKDWFDTQEEQFVNSGSD